MKLASVKGMVAKGMITGLAAAAIFAAGSTTAQAQQFAVGVQFGHPAYVVAHDDYRYDHRYDRDDYRRREEFREREAREEYARRQAYLQHERWEHEQWERAHHVDHDHDYR
ncbi:MAG TPA: hypothetical protein VGN01_09320 [Acidobacteriaceae bacterium]|jgi:hypothetical protein